MPSFRGHIFYQIMKYVVGPKFKRARKSIDQLRRLEDYLIRYQRVPACVQVSQIEDGPTGEWVRTPGIQRDTAILYLHGGAFVMGSPATHRELASQISEVCKSAVLSLDYRLAPEYPFPAAIEDTISAYSWLLSEGYSQNGIILGGDSSGGGLALQSLIELRNRNITLPAAAFFLSPQTDWIHLNGESYSSRANSDPLMTTDMCRFTAKQYVGDNDPDNQLLSPVAFELSGLPPMFIHVGDRELLLSDSVRLAERAQECGIDIKFRVWPGMWHVFQSARRFVPEARQSLDELGSFANDHIG